MGEPQADRPAFAPGYGILPADEGAGLLPWSRAVERLEASRNYWIGTTRPDGAPHAAPVWGVWSDGRLVFGTNPSSRKGRNLAHDPRISVHLESGDDVVILEGVAEQLGDDDRAGKVVDAYERKYGWRPEVADMPRWWTLAPALAFAWLESDFPGTATRYRFSESARP